MSNNNNRNRNGNRNGGNRNGNNSYHKPRNVDKIGTDPEELQEVESKTSAAELLMEADFADRLKAAPLVVPAGQDPAATRMNLVSRGIRRLTAYMNSISGREVYFLLMDAVQDQEDMKKHPRVLGYINRMLLGDDYDVAVEFCDDDATEFDALTLEIMSSVKAKK